MAARSSAVLVPLSTRLNSFVTAILRSPLHWLLSPGLMLITVTGRKTGRRYTIPVGYHRTEDAVIVIVGEAPSKTWWHNYRDAGPIELRLRGKVLHGRAEVVPPDTPEFQRRAEATFRRSRVIPWIFGINFNRRTGLTEAQIKELSEHVAIVRISIH